MRVTADSALQAVLDRRGWAITKVLSTADLLSLADSFGEITPSRAGAPVVDELRPKPSSEARPRSLSAMHGLDAFPFHTDAAHHPIPPRYVFLRLASKSPSARRTLVAPMPRRLAHRHRRTLEHDVWLVDGGRTRFLTSILSQPEGRACDMFRFDEGCMRPADPVFGAARAVMLRILADHSRPIEWEPGRTIVLDNWQTLHGREGASADDAERVLERVMVSER